MNAGSRFLSLLLLPLLFQSPQDRLRQHSEAAEAQERVGNLAAAESEYTAILAEGYRILGKIYSAQKNHKQAVPAYEAAALYQPASNEALLELAITYFDAVQFNKALQPLQKLIAVDPQNSDAHSLLGKTYFALRDYEKAAAELTVALESAHDFGNSFTLAIAYLQQRQFNDARRVFDLMLRRSDNQPQLHLVIGRAFREAGRLPEAIDESRKQ